MNKRIPSVVVQLALLLLMTIGSTVGGEVVSEKRPVAGFDQINLAGFGQVILTQDGTESLTVEAEQDLLPDIETEVRGRTLYLGIRDRHWRRSHWMGLDKGIKYYVSMKSVHGISVSGSGSVTSQKIDTDEIELSISGSGDTDIEDLQAEELDVRISGSGDCDLAGKTSVQKVSISGSGSYDAEDLNSGTAIIRVSGSGDVSVWTENEIDVQISGSGRVEYAGNPKEVSFRSSGSGSVKKVGLK